MTTELEARKNCADCEHCWEERAPGSSGATILRCRLNPPIPINASHRRDPVYVFPIVKADDYCSYWTRTTRRS